MQQHAIELGNLLKNKVIEVKVQEPKDAPFILQAAKIVPRVAIGAVRLQARLKL